MYPQRSLTPLLTRNSGMGYRPSFVRGDTQQAVSGGDQTPLVYHLTDYDLEVLWDYHQKSFTTHLQAASYRRYEHRPLKNPKCEEPNYVGILGEYAAFQILIGHGKWENMLTFTTQRPIYRADHYDLQYGRLRIDVKTFLCDSIGPRGLPFHWRVTVDADSVTKPVEAFVFCFYDQDRDIQVAGWRMKQDFRQEELKEMGQGQNRRQVYQFTLADTYRDINLIKTYAKTH